MQQDTSDALSLILSEHSNGIDLGRRRCPKPADAVAGDSVARLCDQEKIRTLAGIESEQLFRPRVRLKGFLLKQTKAWQVAGLETADRDGEQVQAVDSLLPDSIAIHVDSSFRTGFRFLNVTKR